MLCKYYKPFDKTQATEIKQTILLLIHSRDIYIASMQVY